MKRGLDYYYFAFVCIAFALLIIGLGSYGFTETSEARYAEISREMFLSGDYLNPQLLGIFHFHKPPITYYITTLGYRFFGINEFGARFFLQVAVIIQLLLIYGIANLLYKNKKIAFFSGLIYFSMPMVLIASRNLTTDVYVTTFIIGSIYCWQYYTSRGKLLFLYLFYILIGLALLTKGPVALLFILVYVITYKVIFKSGTDMTIHNILGLLLCLGIGVSWYIFVIAENPSLWDYFINKQIASRISSNSFNRSKPFWFYIPIIIGLLFPWWLSTIVKFRGGVNSIFMLQKETKLLLVSSSILFILFSLFSTKLILYILPVFWMVAIFIAARLSALTLKNKKIIALSYFVLLNLFFFTLLSLWIKKPDFIEVSSSAIIAAFLITVSAFIVYYFIENTEMYKPVILSFLFSIAILQVSTSVMKNNSQSINSTREMMDFINTNGKEHKTILVYNYLLSSIPLYSDANEITINSGHNTTNREVQFQHDALWREHLWDVKDDTTISKLRELSHNKNTYLLVRKRHGLSDDLSFLKDDFNSTKEYAKWDIYYNN
ncbi:ArnT family glycosyltransferase [Psychroserpens luteus]|uniref:ArnT family glycosyltransferase n=1 Tax=Psychroserpens luteus TaxID=1434066 RepID=A0ABW5ZW47_9FLAO|nr:glycosyltransferase family 39 protein [Psychroserpens luteus]